MLVASETNGTTTKHHCNHEAERQEAKSIRLFTEGKQMHSNPTHLFQRRVRDAVAGDAESPE